MKFITRMLIRLVLMLTALWGVFFVWSSSATMENKEYEKLLNYNYESKTDTDSIYSIITYNIGYLSGMTNNRAIAKPKELFDKNLKKVTKALKKENADIIAFQEIDYAAARSFEINQETEIAKLGYNHVARGVNWDKRYLPFPYWPPSMHFGKIVSGQSIASKYPLKDYQRIVLERVPNNPFYKDALYLERLVQLTKVIIEGKEVIVINIHLEAFDKPTRARQFTYVIDLFNSYKKEYPTILLGDFNSKARDEKAVVQQLLNMKGVGNAAFNKNNIENTFDTKDLYERIDYIFYTEDSIEYVNGRVMKEFGQASDHLPIVMNFKLK